MELATKQEQAAAKIAQANAKVEQAQQKSAQVAIASNAKIEAEQAKLAAAAQKTAQAQIAATAKVTAEQTKAAAQQQVAAEKTAQATINANAKIVQSNNKLVADQVKQDKKVYVYLKRGGNGTFRFSVTDTGKGIKPQEIQNIWARYYRSSETHKRPVQGTGLGLSIAKWIVDKHEGHFEVLSVRDLGTRIRIVL